MYCRDLTAFEAFPSSFYPDLLVGINGLRAGNSAHNFALLRHIALNLLRKEKTTKVGIHAKRLKAGWSTSYLEKVLMEGSATSLP